MRMSVLSSHLNRGSVKLDYNPSRVYLIDRGREFHKVEAALTKDLSPYVLSLVFGTVQRNWSDDCVAQPGQ